MCPPFDFNTSGYSSNRQDFDPDKFLSKYKFYILAIVILFLVLPNLIILVGAGQRAVIFNRVSGMEKRVLTEGVQIIIPALQQATIYNVREMSYIFSGQQQLRTKETARWMGNAIETLTADGQNITVDVTVRSRPNFKELWWLHQNLGKDYVEKIIVPLVRSVVREVIAGYTVSAIYSEDRRVIATKISKALEDEMAKYKLVLTEFLLDEVTFSRAYQNAIEEKQQARIELDTKDNIIVEKENERDAIITRAEGDAAAIALKVESLNRYGRSYLDLKKAQILGKRTRLIFEEKF